MSIRKNPTPEQKEAFRERLRARQSEDVKQGRIVTYPFRDWCAMRSISIATGRRLIDAGRVKVTRLSERRIGIRSDHDQEYLDSCLRDSA